MANKIYALVGPHASGKTLLMNQLMGIGVHCIRTYTTREISSTDSDAEMYAHIDKMEFFKKDFIVKASYKGQYYGLLKQDVLNAMRDYAVSMVVIEANGLKQLSKLLKDSLESIYIMCDYVTLVERMLKLGHNNEDIKYHLEFAENNGEFDTWKISTYVVKNVSEPRVALSQLLSIMGLTQLKPHDVLNQLLSAKAK